jgi:predicted transcriptional regulator
MSTKLHITTTANKNQEFGAAKSPENIEFAALMQEMRDWGFRPADVARMLNKSRGAVSHYLTGFAKPSATVLELLRRIVKEKHWDEIEPDTEQKALSKKLRILNSMMHSKYEDIKSQIETLYGHLTPEMIKMAIMSAQGEKAALDQIKMNPSNTGDAISFGESRPALKQPQSEKNRPKASDDRPLIENSSES